MAAQRAHQASGTAADFEGRVAAAEAFQLAAQQAAGRRWRWRRTPRHPVRGGRRRRSSWHLRRRAGSSRRACARELRDRPCGSCYSNVLWLSPFAASPWRRFRDFDAAAPDGAVIGLAGENGSGKGLLLRLAAGMERPAAGLVETSGRCPAAPAGRRLEPRAGPRAAHRPRLRASRRAGARAGVHRHRSPAARRIDGPAGFARGRAAAPRWPTKSGGCTRANWPAGEIRRKSLAAYRKHIAQSGARLGRSGDLADCAPAAARRWPGRSPERSRPSAKTGGPPWSGAAGNWPW